MSNTSIITFSAAACRNHSEASRIYKSRKCRKVGREYGAWKKDMHVGIVAANCSLSPCLRRYSGEVSYSTLKEELVSQESMDYSIFNEGLDDYSNRPWFIKFEPCEVNGRWYGSSNDTRAPEHSHWISWRDGEGSTHEAPKQCVMGLAGALSTGIGSFLNEAVQGDLQFGTSTPQSVTWLSALAEDGNATLEAISDSFDGMATGYTNFMRGDWEEVQNERFSVVGTDYKNAVCIRVDWPWLVYPGVLLVSTMILFIAAYIPSLRQSGKRPVWKSTLLPFLFYNLKINRDEDQDQPDENGMNVPLLQRLDSLLRMMELGVVVRVQAAGRVTSQSIQAKVRLTFGFVIHLT